MLIYGIPGIVRVRNISKKNIYSIKTKKKYLQN